MDHNPWMAMVIVCLECKNLELSDEPPDVVKLALGALSIETLKGHVYCIVLFH